MSGDRYALRFGSIVVGAVTETGSDFPSLWGDLRTEPALSDVKSGEASRLASFIALNREWTRLVDVEHEREVSLELGQINMDLGAHFADFIESEGWYLVDRRGEVLPIL